MTLKTCQVVKYHLCLWPDYYMSLRKLLLSVYTCDNNNDSI